MYAYVIDGCELPEKMQKVQKNNYKIDLTLDEYQDALRNQLTDSYR